MGGGGMTKQERDEKLYYILKKLVCKYKKMECGYCSASQNNCGINEAFSQINQLFSGGKDRCPKIAKDDVDKLWQLVKIQVDDPTSHKDPYMRGMANGLICALAVFKKWEPIYIDAPKKEGKDKEVNLGVSFVKAIRSMLNECKIQNKKSATLTMEEVGEFENSNITIKVEPSDAVERKI